MPRISGSLFFCVCVLAQQKNSERPDIIFDLLRSALEARLAPLGFPVPTGTTTWNKTVLRLNKDTFIITFRPAGGVEFFLQGTMCQPKDKPALWSDAALLGPQETAEAFYRDNFKFVILLPEADFALCMTEGMAMENSERLRDGRNLYTSEERLLGDMSNWVSFFESRDPARALEFVRLIAAKQRDALLDSERKVDYETVARRIGYLDRVFPFDALNSLTLGPQDRQIIRSWLATTLVERRKLSALEPKVAGNIARDEALLRKAGRGPQ